MLRIWCNKEAENKEKHLLKSSVIPEQIEYGVDGSRMKNFLITDFYSDKGTKRNHLVSLRIKVISRVHDSHIIEHCIYEVEIICRPDQPRIVRGFYFVILKTECNMIRQHPCHAEEIQLLLHSRHWSLSVFAEVYLTFNGVQRKNNIIDKELILF